MSLPLTRTAALVGVSVALLAVPTVAQDLETLRPVADQGAAERAKLAQVMVDSIFSFGELGFQEFETSRYLTEILRENGFEVEEGIAGIPTAWMARWGSGSPVIALGSDIDGIPKSSQKPGVAYHDPMIEGAPGHGEGHNSGTAVIVVGALAAKEVMEREGIPGDDRDLARGGGGAAREQGVVHSGGVLRRRGRLHLHPRRQRLRRELGLVKGQRPGLRGIHVRG